MRRFSSLMSLLAVVAMMFVACSDKNPTPGNSDLTFKVSVNSSDKSSVNFSVEPSDKSIDYVVYACENSKALAYDTDAELVAALGEEVSFADYTYRGDVTDVITGLKINTGYSLLVFTQQNNTLVSKLHKSSFRTTAVMYIDCNFNFKTTVENTKVTMIIEPSNRDVNWYHCVMPQMAYVELTSSDKSSEEIIAENYVNTVAALTAAGKSAEEVREELIMKNNRKVTHENLEALTEYICLAAAVEFDGDDMYVKSEVSTTSFTTGEAPVAAGQYTMTVSNVGPYGFVLNIEATSDELYYYPCVDFPETFDEAATIAWLDKVFDEQYQNMLIKYKDNPAIVTNELVLEECPYFAHGDKSFGVGNIPPHTNVMGAIFVLRATTGQVAKVHRFDNLATTVEPSTISPTIEVVGVYSGDEENGEVFGNASATAGRAILVSKASNFEGASHLYSIYGTQGGLDATDYPDWRAIWFFTGYWIELIPEQPYNYHVANWDEQGYLYVYTKDADGLEGHVGRCSAVASVLDMGDIDELKEYFAKTGSLETQSKSLVITE